MSTLILEVQFVTLGFGKSAASAPPGNPWVHPGGARPALWGAPRQLAMIIIIIIIIIIIVVIVIIILIIIIIIIIIIKIII